MPGLAVATSTPVTRKGSGYMPIWLLVIVIIVAALLLLGLITFLSPPMRRYRRMRAM